MSALTFIGYIALLAAIGIGAHVGLAIVRLLDSVGEHRQAQAWSVLKHAGLLDREDSEQALEDD